MNRGIKFAAVITLLAWAAPSLAQEQMPPGAHEELAAQILILDEARVGKPVASHAGEICMVCDTSIGGGDVTYLVNGQRVPVHRAVCDARLKENPRAVLASLRPRGAFLGAETEEPSLSGGWFVFGVYVLLGLFFGATCAHCALRVGRNPVAWFLAGLTFNVVSYAALRALPPRAVSLPAGIPAGLGKIAATRAPVVCPMCGHALHPAATACPGCGVALRPGAVSEVPLAMRAN